MNTDTGHFVDEEQARSWMQRLGVSLEQLHHRLGELSRENRLMKAKLARWRDGPRPGVPASAVVIYREDFALGWEPLKRSEKGRRIMKHFRDQGIAHG